MADLFLTLIREHGFAEKERAKRILRDSGLSGLLAEISLIQSPHIKYEYFRRLILNTSMNDAEREKARNQIEEELGHDTEKTAILKTLLLTQQTIRNVDYFEAFTAQFETISSDYEKRQALLFLAALSDAKQEIILKVFELSAMLPDCGRAKLLIELAPRCADNSPLRAAFLETADTILSKEDKEKALNALEQI
ncbi:MAG: hypothetical protein ABIK28_12155 [Planctomycetota bacterium]